MTSETMIEKQDPRQESLAAGNLTGNLAGSLNGSLTRALQKLLKETESAIRERLSDEPALETQLRERHAAAVQAGRTEGTVKGYNAFADEAITQAAVHWLLGCVFVRFLEDNGWLDERASKVAWIAGPVGRMAIAKDRRSLFLQPDPGLTDRDYLLHVFAEVAKLPGVGGLFNQKHNPLYSLEPTAQGAARIVEFFQRTDPDTNKLIFDFTDREHKTRFLGDLYQNLSESARKLYALCQTPGFVVDFILDRTLTPALDAFGLESVRVIDPACGSGHFVLAAFARILQLWQAKEPGINPPALVQRALDAVYGVDVNAFAVEISRFRLLIAALEASGITRLKEAPDFRFNLAAGDSLLHGSRIRGGGIQRDWIEDRMEYFYQSEDAEELKRILGQPYQVVVGNPPYINVKDAVVREAYRSRFVTCHGQYQLGVPFIERFFDLTTRSESTESTAGFMGMIVSNAFMTRSFGRVLIEDYLSYRDLTHVIDTSGLNFPGHGTPTTILLGRNRIPIPNKDIRAVLGIVGVLSQNEDLARSPVWQEIVGHIDEPAFVGAHISVADVPRRNFERHPWAIAGGGASQLKRALEESATLHLSEITRDIGVIGRSSADEIFVAPVRVLVSRNLDTRLWRPLGFGESLRDWQIGELDGVLFPYGEIQSDPLENSHFAKWVWPCRTTLGNRATFAQRTYFEENRPWWGWHQLSLDRLTPPISIAFAEIATHNHFVLDFGSKIFNQTAPIIKLDSTATVDEYQRLLGLLNCSTGCFWLRQVAHDKGGGGVGGGLSSEAWERRKCFTVTIVQDFPVPIERPPTTSRHIQTEADARSEILPEKLCAVGVPTRIALDAAREKASIRLVRMIALQEELDWQCYRLYGILEDDLTLQPEQVPPLKLGERAFEILLARKGEQTTWFERHHSTPITALPEHWPEAYRNLVERRIAAIETNRDIALIERPEYKRRWNLPLWEELESAALKSWLLDRMEQNPIWAPNMLVSCSQLRDAMARDPDWLAVAEVYSGGPVEDLQAFVTQLAMPEAVPFLPALRYTETGLRKRTEWEQVWELQRREDAGETVEIPVPPKYVSKDFQRSDYWRLRGGLDVPKERWISYPTFERDSDASPVLGSAGWSHLEQARALAGYYQRMRTEEGWDPERLKPVLAGLLDLKPWLLQWHNELDPEMGEKLGEYFVRFAEAQSQELGFFPQAVLAWAPAAATTAGRRRRNRPS